MRHFETPAKHDAWITLLAFVLLIAWDASGWDREVARWYGNAAGFPLREAWLTSTLLHDGGRRLAWAALAIMVLDTMRPWLAGPSRRSRWYWVGATVAGALIVSSIKRVSHTSCPWDLADFGGRATYVPHWMLGLHDGGSGHCFPSGHAVAAFAFFSLYFLWRPYRPVFARWLLSGVVGLGLLFGWTQLARGAHFPSHTLWSAWLCWTWCATAAQVQLRFRSRFVRNSAQKEKNYTQVTSSA